MKAKSKPDVKMRKSGVRYVEAADVLRSESGRDQISKAARHFENMRRNSRQEGEHKPAA